MGRIHRCRWKDALVNSLHSIFVNAFTTGHYRVFKVRMQLLHIIEMNLHISSIHTSWLFSFVDVWSNCWWFRAINTHQRNFLDQKNTNCNNFVYVSERSKRKKIKKTCHKMNQSTNQYKLFTWRKKSKWIHLSNNKRDGIISGNMWFLLTSKMHNIIWRSWS